MSGKLKWRFDASTFKLLGRGLITDRITAIYELVKNCYDANATTVEVIFSHVEKRGPKSTITIRDNGFGMSLADIRDKWLVVGTASKRTTRSSPAPFNRRYIGEKGVGRFATDKLGEHLRIKTKRKEDKEVLSVTINWSDYEKPDSAGQQRLFTELENDYSYIELGDTFIDGHGTELVITMLHESWDREMLLRLNNQLGRILPPLLEINPPFNIFLSALELNIPKELVIAEPIEELATVHVSIPCNKESNKQGKISFNHKTEKFDTEMIAAHNFGPISMELYFFNADAKKQFRNKYKTDNYIEGAKVYRDGVICTPFAEYESVLDYRRDVLGIDKRRYRAAFDRLNTREFIAIINITKDDNPKIIDATNRQDFVDNIEYRHFKDFIIEQLDELSAYRAVRRKEEKEQNHESLKRASVDVKDIGRALTQLVKERPELKEALTPTIQKAKQATTLVSEGAKGSQEAEKEFQRKEALYLSLMSMQDFASELAHGIRFAIAPIKHASEFIIKYYDDNRTTDKRLNYTRLIYKQAVKIGSLVNFMLSYSKVDIEDTTFSIKNLLTETLNEARSISFEKENIELIIDVQDNIQLTGKRRFLEDVIENLVSNSVKALKNEPNKKIVCESYSDEDNIHIIFSDNGTGVNPKIAGNMFEIFKTTTAEEGGGGLGLFIAKTRMSALNGKIELVQSIFNPKGASFMLSIPLKK